MSNNWYQDQDRRFVGTDHGSNCLHVARSNKTRSSVDWVHVAPVALAAARSKAWFCCCRFVVDWYSHFGIL